jgi:hypothetical protein
MYRNTNFFIIPRVNEEISLVRFAHSRLTMIKVNSYFHTAMPISFMSWLFVRSQIIILMTIEASKTTSINTHLLVCMYAIDSKRNCQTKMKFYKFVFLFPLEANLKSRGVTNTGCQITFAIPQVWISKSETSRGCTRSKLVETLYYV